MNGESAGNALRKVIQSGLSVKKIRDVNKIMARQKLGYSSILLTAKEVLAVLITCSGNWQSCEN